MITFLFTRANDLSWLGALCTSPSILSVPAPIYWPCFSQTTGVRPAAHLYARPPCIFTCMALRGEMRPCCTPFLPLPPSLSLNAESTPNTAGSGWWDDLAAGLCPLRPVSLLMTTHYTLTLGSGGCSPPLLNLLLNVWMFLYGGEESERLICTKWGGKTFLCK